MFRFLPYFPLVRILIILHSVVTLWVFHLRTLVFLVPLGSLLPRLVICLAICLPFWRKLLPLPVSLPCSLSLSRFARFLDTAFGVPVAELSSSLHSEVVFYFNEFFFLGLFA